MRIRAVILIFVALGLADCKKEAPPLETPRPAPVISSSVVNPPQIDTPRAGRGGSPENIREIPQGATIRIRNNEAISLQNAQAGQTFSALVAVDVIDTKGVVAIPRGSEAVLVVLGDKVLDIGGVTVRGHRYGLEGSKRGDANAKAAQIAVGTLLGFRLDAPTQIREIR
jgi:hypothetical protein